MKESPTATEAAQLDAWSILSETDVEINDLARHELQLDPKSTDSIARQILAIRSELGSSHSGVRFLLEGVHMYEDPPPPWILLTVTVPGLSEEESYLLGHHLAEITDPLKTPLRLAHHIVLEVNEGG